jgi:hypothetical protein
MVSDQATFRYNVSQNDKNTQLGSITIPLMANCFTDTTSNVRFLNNTLHSATATSMVGMFSPISAKFHNNVFSSGASGASIDDPTGVYDHNLYQNVSAVPEGDAFAVVGDPLLTDPGASEITGYRLRCGSPALAAGVAVEGEDAVDIFGNPPLRADSPNIGVYQGPCIEI